MAKLRKQYNKFYETNNCGTLEILSRDGKQAVVRFLDTDYTTRALIANILAGKVSDPVAKKKKLEEWVDYHEEFVNNSGEKFTAFSRNRKKVKIVFEATGYTCEVFIDNARAGKVKDPYARSYLGVGYLGDADKRDPIYKQAMQLWRNMIKRCYNPKDEKGYYGRCFVSDDWLCFANFLRDIKDLENFNGWLLGHDDGPTKYNLDKDLKVEGNKIYSKLLCSFVTEYENKSAGARNARRLDKVGSQVTTAA